MDTTNALNNTQSVPETGNPQQVPATGTNNSSEFQETAPSDALNQSAVDLSVQKTGEPLTGVTTVSDSGMSTAWVIGIGVLVIIAIVVLYKLLKEAAAEQKTSSAGSRSVTPRSNLTVTTQAPFAKKSVKKSVAKKKPTSSKARKKTAKKRK